MFTNFDDYNFSENLSLIEYITEKLITFGNTAYPKFGNVVIMAGGAGSGKGFVKEKLLGIEGFVFDVDALKQIAIKTPKFVERVKNELGIDLTTFNFKSSDDVSKIHYILSDHFGIDDKKIKNLTKSILAASKDRKPNLIFDVTLKDIYKFKSITDLVKMLGYESQNIHLVWVVNDIEVAIQQNLKRSRTVPTEILVNTHRGASNTMGDIIKMGERISTYLDGDIVFVFNKAKVDSTLKKSDMGGSYIEDANYVYMKTKNNPVVKYEDISQDIIQKIKDYTPGNVW